MNHVWDRLDDLPENATADETDRVVQEAFHEGVEQTYRDLKRRQLRLLWTKRRMRRGFERRLAQRYQHAFDLFDLFVIACRNAGMEFNRLHRDRTVHEQDYIFEALARIHARACLVTSEVRALLVSGHASGALARWRTLHELAVVAYVVKAHDQRLAERYMLHQWIVTAREAEGYVTYAERMKHEAYPPAELESLRKTKDDLIARFGPEYAREYGWAFGYVEGKPTFADLEASVGLDFWRPHVGMASYSVHAGFNGMVFDIGHLGTDAGEVMLAGPSNAGLIEAGDATLIDLNNCTVALLAYRPTPESAIQIAALSQLLNESRDAFFEAHLQLIRDEEAIRAAVAADGDDLRSG